MNERGSMLPMLAGLIAAALIVVVLALDVTLYAAAVREAAFAADSGAEAGAATIDAVARYEGILAVDTAAAPDVAVAAAVAARPRPGREVTVDAALERVCVTVVQPFRGRLVTVDSDVEVTACAVPVEG